MNSHELSNYTYANANIMKVKDMFCLWYFPFVLVCISTQHFCCYGFVRMHLNSFIQVHSY